MKCRYEQDSLCYKVDGIGENIILLHGWGSNKETFDNVVNHLKEDFCCYQIDLPGFGGSVINEALSLDEYTEILNDFIIKNNITNPIILGHSFGGRIAIDYASKYKVNKLILVNSAGIRKFKLSVFLKIRLYKMCKKLNIKNNLGSVDYKNSNSILKQTMNKIVPIDLSDRMKMIECETLLLWGEHDTITPLKEGKLINRYIKGSTLITIPKSKHFPYIEKYRYFMLVLNSFLASDTV